MPLALVVDDNRDLADNVAELLCSEGLECLTAYGAAEARALMRNADKHCDLAVVDIRMPEESGVDLLVDIKARCPDAEVILMTANASLDTALRAVQEGAFAYIEKPFDPQQLLMLGERAITQARLRRDRSRLQADLKRSEALYRTVVDGVEALIFSVGSDDRAQMCNRPARKLLGYDGDELLEHPLPAFAASESSGEALATALAEARRGRPQQNVEVTLVTGDGRERVTRWNLAPMIPARVNEGSEPPRQPLVLAVGVDVTDRAELERRAAEAEAMAALATLTAGLAHEIRNPLNAASLQLKLLRRVTGKLDDQALQAQIERRSEIVEEELARLSSLLNDFLKLAKPQRLQLTPLSVKELFAKVCDLEDPAASDHGVTLARSLDDDDLKVLGDRDMLVQVLVNLINNALDALGGAGGHIDLRAHAQGASRVAIEVRDNGPGIPPEIAKDLFTPFVTSKEAGTGLGLTIVKRIIDRHGGTIQASANDGGGTLMRISLERIIDERASGSA